ncbi:MAG TPA: S8 family serine peptidase [Acidimicrobiales bacterium]|nr:S8 family serine peptidase [Acidimicrobiales bacterium]
MTRRKNLSVLVAVLVAVTLLTTAPAGAASASGSDRDPVVVRFAAGTPAAERSQALVARGLEVVDTAPGTDFVLARPTTSRRPAAGGAVAEISPTVAVQAHTTPNDPLYSSQWHLPMVQSTEAWTAQPAAGKGVVVAVIDSGAASHTRGVHTAAPDLADTTFVAGWDFVEDDATPDDSNGHGTHVTGTLAQSTDNGVGVAGLSHKATIMPIRVLDANGSGSDWNVAKAIRFAADNGAKVANLSLGGPTGSTVVADAVTYASGMGVVIVASTGNEGVSSVSYPAAFPEVIAVGAVRYDKTRPTYSNYGEEIDLVGPGGDLSVDQNKDRNPDGVLQQTLQGGEIGKFCYCFMAGTSMAVPHVSAAAAMIVAGGTTDPAAVRRALVGSAEDLGPAGWDPQYGAGLLQTADALSFAAAALAAPEPKPEPAPEPAATEPEPTLDYEPGVTARAIDDSCPEGWVVEGGFTDVPSSDVHSFPIDCVATWGIAKGITATTFDPSGTVSRAQMASFVARTIEEAGHALPADPPDAFSDDGTSVHHLRINQLAAVGVVKGSGDGRYWPEATVSRAAMATFLVRAHDLIVDQPMVATGNWFTDDDGHTHEANINKAASAGIAAGTGDGKFSPDATVRRNQMASFIARTLDLLIETGATTAPS